MAAGVYLSMARSWHRQSDVSRNQLMLAGIVIIFIVFVVRRLYFHPLSHIPGPFLAKLSNAYSAYYSYRGTMHLDIQRCHQRYGDVIRYGPNKVLTLHTEDMRGVYGHGKPFRKSRGYETMNLVQDGYSTMTSIDKSMHHNLRRLFRVGVSSDYLTHYEPVILRNLEAYSDLLSGTKRSDRWSKTTDMRRWTWNLAFDTMAEFGLGLRTNLISTDAQNFVFPALHSHEKFVGVWEEWPDLNAIGLANLVNLSMMFVSGKVRSFYYWYRSFMEKAIELNTEEPHGIFGPVIQSGQGKLKRPGHNKAQMITEGSLTTFTSADGYANIISGFTYYLSQYPYVYEKLAKELRSKFQPGQQIQWGHELESVSYLRAVIDEVMRLIPGACGPHWRVCEGVGVTIGPDQVSMPTGSDIGISLFSVFRDGRVFRRPVQFWPERWQPGVLPEDEFDLAKRMFKPFLTGPRNCAGSHVGIMMASIACAHLLVNYDFRLDGEQVVDASKLWSNNPEEIGTDADFPFESHSTMACWKEGPFVQFKIRRQEEFVVQDHAR